MFFIYSSLILENNRRISNDENANSPSCVVIGRIMFFFNGRIRNTHIIPIITHERSYTQRMSQSCIIVGCLLVVVGLVLIIMGTISEIEKTTFFGLGITSLCLGLIFAILICSYTKLDICYHKWAYGSHVTPTQMEASVTATAGAISIHYNAAGLSIIQRTPVSTVLPAKMVLNTSENQTTLTPVMKYGP